ncbi:MAG: flap endonuclease [Polyangiaceae bacterium]|nr:flap endonuclease [Polyangiaceae bacterium]
MPPVESLPSSAPPAAPRVHLVDATYELFRSWFGAPPARAPDGREVGAVRGLAATLLRLVRDEGATHVGCATDHVVRSFRNDLYAGYKTDEGVPPALLAQFELAEELMRALGFVVWAMVDFEADDALATAAARYAPLASQVLVASPDKDLAQCVRGTHVVQLDRRKGLVLDEAAVLAKHGVPPVSIPDWLALVGDSADGYPGLPGWGAKSAAAVLRVHGHLEDIPADPAEWRVAVRGAPRLAATLAAGRDEAALYKTLATLRLDAPVPEPLAELAWQGARPELRELAPALGLEGLLARVPLWSR